MTYDSCFNKRNDSYISRSPEFCFNSSSIEKKLSTSSDEEKPKEETSDRKTTRAESDKDESNKGPKSPNGDVGRQ